jgi:hypothetical protein
MKYSIVGVLLFVLVSGCSSTTQANQSPQTPQASPGVEEGSAPPEATPQTEILPDYGPAPELDNQVWLNVPAALRLEDLRGQVVLLDMWTFG